MITVSTDRRSVFNLLYFDEEIYDPELETHFCYMTETRPEAEPVEL